MSNVIFKTYTVEEALKLAKIRYEKMAGRLPLTIQKLDKDQHFQDVFNNLKSKKYPDWAIYMAIMNIVINYRIQNSPKTSNTPEEYNRLWKLFMDKVETSADIDVPLEKFNEKEIEFAMDLFLMSFLKGQGYEMRRATPNIARLRKFAEETYKVFEYDVPHARWFTFEKEAKNEK